MRTHLALSASKSTLPEQIRMLCITQPFPDARPAIPKIYYPLTNATHASSRPPTPSLTATSHFPRPSGSVAPYALNTRKYACRTVLAHFEGMRARARIAQLGAAKTTRIALQMQRAVQGLRTLRSLSPKRLPEAHEPHRATRATLVIRATVPRSAYSGAGPWYEGWQESNSERAATSRRSCVFEAPGVGERYGRRAVGRTRAGSDPTLRRGRDSTAERKTLVRYGRAMRAMGSASTAAAGIIQLASSMEVFPPVFFPRLSPNCIRDLQTALWRTEKQRRQQSAFNRAVTLAALFALSYWFDIGTLRGTRFQSRKALNAQKRPEISQQLPLLLVDMPPLSGRFRHLTTQPPFPCVSC
ncbi:hypothetical protein HYPSUDRAFT_203864 [Hypholoma sublateritium FD-334 SS-4]|uniref:Uncharacterized protein n=1 Tax=Hypholoma sublateritium (strain FD-334 SS-4) TaxID=945553 RepID=A0A0D2PK73_HYPSF|nr:hypothetical protein HYPSUDRAFT_203864 [Hypholoma sublateritium FD-334 SS-4]